MRLVKVKDFQSSICSALKDVETNGQHIAIVKYGRRPAAVVVPLQWYVEVNKTLNTSAQTDENGEKAV